MAISSVKPEPEIVEGAPSSLEREGRRTSLSVLRDATLSLTHIVEDSTELLGATIREELARFRMETALHALSGVAVVIGGGLLTAGLAMYLNLVLESWPLTLVIFGALYLGAAFLLLRTGTDDSAS